MLAAVLTRRLLGRPFLAMRTRSSEACAPPNWHGLELCGYHAGLEGPCRALLDAVATLGPWPRWRFHREILQRCEDPARFVWVVLEQGRPVAFASLQSAAHSGWLPLLDHLAVSPHRRGLGLGERLVRQVRADAASAGYPVIGLETAGFRGTAIHIYLRVGFEPWPRSLAELVRWRRALSARGGAP